MAKQACFEVFLTDPRTNKQVSVYTLKLPVLMEGSVMLALEDIRARRTSPLELPYHAPFGEALKVLIRKEFVLLVIPVWMDLIDEIVPESPPGG